MTETTVLLLAIAGGILPALFWLWFWLREDQEHPEPTWQLIITFATGMLAAIVALELQLIQDKYFTVTFTAALFLVSAIEEVVKFAASYIAGINTRSFDEPIDAPIYLITAALGFAALENVFYLLTPLLDGNLTQGLVSGNTRFIGATLLHLLASATVGIALAFAYYKGIILRIIYVSVGLCIAIILHTAFNYLIIDSIHKETPELLFAAFALVWGAIIILLLFFEKIKALTRKHNATT
ncbi:MAG: PrsW family glutamic-type intramembrane protease [Candidatus Paceibacterota bacterium]